MPAASSDGTPLAAPRRVIVAEASPVFASMWCTIGRSFLCNLCECFGAELTSTLTDGFGQGRPLSIHSIDPMPDQDL
jgi:hypothetical protein